MNLRNVNEKWVRTDDLQWRKSINETSFDLVEVRKYPDGYVCVTGIIDVEDYDYEEKNAIITAYYSSMEEFEKSYPKEEINGVLAECIFEMTSEIELICFGLFETEEVAEEFMLQYISKL